MEKVPVAVAVPLVTMEFLAVVVAPVAAAAIMEVALVEQAERTVAAQVVFGGDSQYLQ
jgi:hypothetical protein